MADRTGGYRGDAERLLRRRYDRADFLRLIGAGATLPFVPISFAAFGARPGEAQTIVPEILSEEGEYPIGVWSPPPAAETTAERYAEIANANFNFVIGGNGATGNGDHPLTLAAAEAAGLRFLLTDNILQNAVRGEVSRNQQQDVTQRIERLLAEYGNRQALAGFNLYDEPNSRLFGILVYAKKELQRLAPQELPYVNVWPSYAAPRALGAKTYVKYLNRYFGAVRPPLLSFDHYPLLSKGITSDYFYNWAVIRNFSRQFGVPSWGFIQSVGFNGRKVGLSKRRRPTEDELFWQINVALVYGAKGLQYFTYWTPVDPRIQFGSALISANGEQTELYTYAQRANDYLRKVGEQLLPLTSEFVVHAGVKKKKPGVQPFKADGWLRAVGGSPVILGRFFQNLPEDPERYLLVANRSSANAARTRLTVSDPVVNVSRFDATSTDQDPYDTIPLEGTPPSSFQVNLQPGRAELYRLSRTTA